jgi:hypothetical protein
MSSGDVPMEYRQLKRLTQDYILPLILNWKFILVLCGQGSSFMVNDISGVFYAKINDVDYAIGNAERN